MAPVPPGTEPGADAPPDEGPPFDVGVVGLGPAGIAASTELVRYGRSVVAFERDRIGGLINLARRVENFPIEPAGSPGTRVVELLWGQLERFSPHIIEGDVDELVTTTEGFHLRSRDEVRRVRSLIVATGTRPRWLGVEGEDLKWVVRSWTDMPMEGGRTGRVAVVGGGDLAVDQCLSLHDAGHDMVILVRTSGLRCNLPLRREVSRTEGVKVRKGCIIRRFEEDEERRVVYDQGGEELSLSVDAVLVSIGRLPDMPHLDGHPMDLMQVPTYSRKGLFLAGDILSGRRRQVAIAMGSGLDAAMRCEEYCRRLGE